jgi:membrane protein implicated in regulation of membrane protease activity
MTWSDFYLLCFLVGFSLCVLSFLAGAVHLHLPFKMHLPFHGGHHGGGAALRGGLKGSMKGGLHLSWFNASTVMAFLAWFGGTGYIITKHAHLTVMLALGIATLAGLIAGWVVLVFMLKLLRSGNPEMQDSDFRMEGSIGTVSLPIRPNGTGELIFEQNGVRRSAGARSADGEPLEKGAEVVIERYEKGIAYVRKWDEFTK